MQQISRAIYISLLFVVASLQPVSALAQTTGRLGPPDAHMASMIAHERTAHVGQLLPHGTEVVNDAGHKVDLRSLLQHGPVIIIKISNVANCSPCATLFKALHETHGKSIGKPQARIVILRVNDPHHASMGLPAAVTELHSASNMRQQGFLAGHITPTAFYFDKQLKLVKRWPGLASAQRMLHFPSH